MFCVVYSFKVIQDKEMEFIKAWTELTQLIYQYEGSLGSRLHKGSDHEYIAYAQWQSRSDWENAGSKLPEIVDIFRSEMKNSCTEIETVYTLDPVSDLLKSIPYNKEN